MSNVTSNAFLAGTSVTDHTSQVCAPSLPLQTVINETLTGYFIASKDGANFNVIDPRSVSGALSDGFCVYYIDEPLIDYSTVTDTTVPENDGDGHPQPILIKDVSTELVLFDHSESIPTKFTSTEQVVSLTGSAANKPLPAYTPMQLDLLPISASSAKISSLNVNDSKTELVPEKKCGSLECMVCHFIAPSKAGLRHHMQTHENEKPHSCSHCATRFNYAENLLIHVTLAHTTANELSAPYSCPLCDVQVSRYTAFRSHVSLHQVDEQLLCKTCHRVFQSHSLLEAHRRTEHAVSLTDRKFLNKYRCHLCETVIYSLGNLTKHYRRCHPDQLKSGRRVPMPSDSIIPAVTKTMPLNSAWKTTTPVNFSHPLEETPGREMRASKLRAKAYLASLKPRSSKPRHEREDLCNLMIGVADWVQTEKVSKIQPPGATNIDSTRKRNTHVCSVCGKRFPKPCLKQRHMVRHTLTKPFECLLCHARFTRMSTARTHVLTHSDTSTYFCPICSREYARRRNLILHLTRAHPDISVGFVNEQQQQRKGATQTLSLEANPCGSANYSHILYAYPPTTDGPPVVTVPEPLMNSMYNMGPVVSQAVSYVPFPEPCEIIELGSEQEAQEASSRHSFLCSVCQKAFASSRTLSVHLLRHSSAPLPYACSVCSRRFATRSHQRYHINRYHTHNTNRKIQSNSCAQHRSTDLSLTVYDGPIKWNAIERRFHRTTRPMYGSHACSLCPRRYRNPNHLRAHVRQKHNTSLAPFACALCRRRFVTINALDRHMSRGHTRATEPRRICPICELSFVNISSMKRHMVVHSNDRPYRCSWCFRSFKFHSSCMKHMKAQVCRSRLLVPSSESVVVVTSDSQLAGDIGSTNHNHVSVHPSCSETAQLTHLIINQQPSLPAEPTSVQTDGFWPVCTTTVSASATMIDRVCTPHKIHPLPYSLLPVSVNQESQPQSQLLEVNQASQPHTESSDGLTWTNSNAIPILLDSTPTIHANGFFIEPLPTLVQHTDPFEHNMASEPSIPNMTTAIALESTDTRGYTNLLMGPDFTRDSAQIVNSLAPQSSWSYIADVNDAQPATAESGFDHWVQPMVFSQLPQPTEPCVNLIPSNIVEKVGELNHENSLLHPSQPSVAQSEPTQSNPQQPTEPEKVQCTTGQNSITHEEQSAQSNMKTKSRPPIFGCALCHASFVIAEDLLVHSHTCHSILHSQYTCSFCDMAFASELLLVAHTRSHDNNTQAEFSCPMCPSSVFGNQSGLTRHINYCHPAPNSHRFQCSRCGDRFSQLRQLRTHVNASSCSLVEPIVPDVQTTPSPRKNQSRLNRRNRKARILSLRPKDVLDLVEIKPSDDLTLSEQYLIKAAAEVIHDSNEQSSETKDDGSKACARLSSDWKPHPCSVCTRSFRLASDLRRHMCLHTGDRPFKCTQCNRQYLKHCQLRHHQLRMHGNSITPDQNMSSTQKQQLRFDCHVCNRSFTNKFNLFRHIRLHASRLRFTCPRCHRRFVSAAQKQVHLKNCSQADLFDVPDKTKLSVNPGSTTHDPISFLDQLNEDCYQPATSNAAGRTCSSSEEMNETKLPKNVVSDTTAIQMVDLDDLPTPSETLIPMGNKRESETANQPEVPDVPLIATKTIGHGLTDEPEIVHLPNTDTSAEQRTEETSSVQSDQANHADQAYQSATDRFTELIRCATCAQDFSDLPSYTKHTCLNRLIDRHRLTLDPKQPITVDANESIRSRRTNNKLQALYKCAKCGRIYHKLNTLQRHETTHENRGAHLCKTCGATFTRRSSLINHERIHLGIKPYRCSHCAMEFRQRSNMRRHIKQMHT